MKSGNDQYMKGAVLAKCFGFLGVDSTVEISDAQRRLNSGNTKLYDTQKLRNMRNYVLNPGTSIALHKLDLDIQDQFLEELGLRQRFTNDPLDWDQESLDRVIGALQDEIPIFLQTFGKPRNFWPRFTQALNQV